MPSLLSEGSFRAGPRYLGERVQGVHPRCSTDVLVLTYMLRAMETQICGGPVRSVREKPSTIQSDDDGLYITIDRR